MTKILEKLKIVNIIVIVDIGISIFIDCLVIHN